MGLWENISNTIGNFFEARVLRERLALANDQSATLRNKVANLEAEKSVSDGKIANLQAENERLHLNLRQAEEQIGNLKRQLSISHGQHLDEAAVQILVFIAHHLDCTTETLARDLKLHPERVLYYKDELVQQTYLDYGFTGLDQEYYQLTPPGRKFLIEQGLL